MWSVAAQGLRTCDRPEIQRRASGREPAGVGLVTAGRLVLRCRARSCRRGCLRSRAPDSPVPPEPTLSPTPEGPSVVRHTTATIEPTRPQPSRPSTARPSMGTPTRRATPSSGDRRRPRRLSLDDAIDGTMVEVEDGQIVEGTVVKVDQDEVLLDIGYKTEGVIPAASCRSATTSTPPRSCRSATRSRPSSSQKEDKEGRLILSKKRAQYERAWGTIEKIKEERRRRRAARSSRSSRAASSSTSACAASSRPRWSSCAGCATCSPYVGTHARGQDHRARQEPQQRRAVPPGLARGDPVRAARGVPHQPQAGRGPQGRRLVGRQLRRLRRPRRHGRPRPRVASCPGSTSTTPARSSPSATRSPSQVLDVDLDRERISLSLKATQQDPWQEFAGTHEVGELVYGRVTKLVPFGAFVQVGEGIEGLVHISEMSAHHVDLPEQVVTPGEELWVKIIDLDLAASPDLPVDQAGRRGWRSWPPSTRSTSASTPTTPRATTSASPRPTEARGGLGRVLPPSTARPGRRGRSPPPRVPS